jgi:hypothetical protein
MLTRPHHHTSFYHGWLVGYGKSAGIGLSKLCTASYTEFSGLLSDFESQDSNRNAKRKK